MQVFQSNYFKKQVKKLHPQLKKILDDAVRQVMSAPLSGEKKIGDLQEVYVYKFRMQNALMLLAYAFSKTTLTLLSFGSHENFYRDLKKHSKV